MRPSLSVLTQSQMNIIMVDTPGLTTVTIVDTSSEILINTTNQLFYFIFNASYNYNYYA